MVVSCRVHDLLQFIYIYHICNKSNSAEQKLYVYISSLNIKVQMLKESIKNNGNEIYCDISRDIE